MTAADRVADAFRPVLRPGPYRDAEAASLAEIAVRVLDADPTTEPAPDLDAVLDAVVALIEATTYSDAAVAADERAIVSAYRDRHPDAKDLRTDAAIAEETATAALFALLDHERVLRLIPRLSEVRYCAARRADEAYDALPATDTAVTR